MVFIPRLIVQSDIFSLAAESVSQAVKPNYIPFQVQFFCNLFVPPARHAADENQVLIFFFHIRLPMVCVTRVWASKNRPRTAGSLIPADKERFYCNYRFYRLKTRLGVTKCGTLPELLESMESGDFPWKSRGFSDFPVRFSCTPTVWQDPRGVGPLSILRKCVKEGPPVFSTLHRREVTPPPARAFSRTYHSLRPMLPSNAMTTAMKSTNNIVIQIGEMIQRHGQPFTPQCCSVTNRMVSGSATPRQWYSFPSYRASVSRIFSAPETQAKEKPRRSFDEAVLCSIKTYEWLLCRWISSRSSMAMSGSSVWNAR